MLDVDPSAAEATRLRECLNDVIGIMALPSHPPGSEPAHIASTFLDALLGTLRLSLGCVRLHDPEGGPPIEIVRVADSWADAPRVHVIRKTIESLSQANPTSRSGARIVLGDIGLSVTFAPLGVRGEIGTLSAAALRSDFPTPTERLVLDVAASQATISLQQTRLLRESDRKSRLLVDSIPGLVALLTANGEVEFVNRQIVEYTGRNLQELKSWGTDDTVHPEDLPLVVEAFTRSIVSGSPYEIVQRLRRKDGAYLWFQNNGFPLRDGDGRILRWCVLLTDVDERKRAEDALRESERESRLIVDSIPGFIAAFTPGGEVEFVNRPVLEYFGKTMEELKRWGTGGMTHPEDLQRILEHFTHSMASGEPFEWEVRARRFDGVYRWFQSRGYPLRDVDGHIVRWYNLLIDIDERKRAGEDLRASERNLKLLIDTIPAPAWSARPDGSAEFFNQQYLDFIGLSAEQADGWGWTAAVHPEDIKGLAATWQRIIASEAPGEAEARLRRHDGQYRWFLFRTNPLHDETGSIVKWYGVNTDIEDRKQAEDALLASALNLRQMTETIPEMLWSAAANGAIEYCNNRFLHYTGFTADEVMGDGWQKTIHPDDAARVAPVWMACVATGAPYGVEVRTFHAADRTYRLCAVTALPLHDEQGHIMKWHGTIIDIQDSRQAQEELRNTQAALAHVTRVTTMGELTASIAHEINQPLSGIITNANTCLRMLADNVPDIEGARETARRTIRDGNRASQVIERLRELFRKQELTTEAVDVNDAIRGVIALSSSELHKNQVMLRFELADDLPLVSGDRVQLQQVVLNLVMNASEAMGGVNDRRRQILLRTERDNTDHVRVMVQDTGVGFEPHCMDRLFEAFYTTKSTGMGMGLSVSRSIIERHHGRFWATLNDGPGATFSFSIPVNPASALPVGSG